MVLPSWKLLLRMLTGFVAYTSKWFLLELLGTVLHPVTKACFWHLSADILSVLTQGNYLILPLHPFP